MFELHVRTHAPDRQRDSNKVWLILQNYKKKKEKEKKKTVKKSNSYFRRVS